MKPSVLNCLSQFSRAEPTKQLVTTHYQFLAIKTCSLPITKQYLCNAHMRAFHIFWSAAITLWFVTDDWNQSQSKRSKNKFTYEHTKCNSSRVSVKITVDISLCLLVTQWINATITTQLSTELLLATNSMTSLTSTYYCPTSTSTTSPVV